MAIMGSNLLKDLKGHLGKQIVVKQYSDKTVVAKYPFVKKKRKPTELQQVFRDHFTEAVKYAQTINNNWEQKAIYQQKVKKGQSVYHYALKEYLEKNKLKRGAWKVRDAFGALPAILVYVVRAFSLSLAINKAPIMVVCF